MVVPVIYGGYLVATIAGRIAISVIARYAAKHGLKKAATRFGSKILRNNRVKSAISQATKQFKTKVQTAVKTTVKGTVKGQRGKIISKAKPKIKFKATSKKQIAIQKKIITKYKKPPKVKTKPSKKVTVAKPKKVITKKPTKVKTKPTKKVTQAKPKKVIKKKPSKALTVKKPSKALTIFKGKKPPTAITKIAKVKKFKPGFWTGVTVGGGGAALLDLLKKGFKAPPLKPGIDKDKDKIKIKPKIKPEKVREKPGPQSGPTVKKKLEPRFLRVPPKSGPTIKKKFTEEREKSFEGRVKALVAQKDRLKKIPAGDGVRSEYQVRMHKLKLENKKAWKQLFTIGGKLK